MVRFVAAVHITSSNKTTQAKVLTHLAYDDYISIDISADIATPKLNEICRNPFFSWAHPQLQPASTRRKQKTLKYTWRRTGSLVPRDCKCRSRRPRKRLTHRRTYKQLWIRGQMEYLICWWWVSVEKGGGSVLDLVSSCIVCTQNVHCSGLKWMLPSNFAS